MGPVWLLALVIGAYGPWVSGTKGEPDAHLSQNSVYRSKETKCTRIAKEALEIIRKRHQHLRNNDATPEPMAK